MSSLKKVLALAVSVAMLVLATVPAFAATVPSDVKGTDYEKAATRLAGLDIMVGDAQGNFNAANEITRAEMAKIVVAIKNMTAAADLAKGATPFTDVAADHWASGFINVAQTEGLVKGTSATTFNPDDKVTYAQAVTMIVRACGYVNLQGVWPTNYMNKAAEIGVTKSVNVAGSVAGVRGEIAKLVNNALDAKPMKVKTVDVNGVPTEYEVEDTTVVAKYFDLTEKTGIPMFTHNEDPENVDEGEIVVSVKGEDGKYQDTTYELGTVDMHEYLGKEILFYLDDDATTPTIQSIKEVKTSSDKVITPKKFGTDDVSNPIKVVKVGGAGDNKDNFSSFTIQYVNSNDSEKTITGVDTINCVFNGRKFEISADSEDLAATVQTNCDKLIKTNVGDIVAQDLTGSIVKTSDDEVYLIINAWTEPVVVTDVKATGSSKKLTVKDTGAYAEEELDEEYSFNNDALDAENVEIVVTKDGQAATLEDIEEDDVLEILRSYVGASYNDVEDSRLEINVTRNTVTGTVSKISKISSKVDTIKIDDTSYKINDRDIYSANVTAGNSVKLLLDKNGEVEKVVTSGSAIAGNYAVAIYVEEQENSSNKKSMKEAAKVDLLLADGTEKVFTAKDDLRVYNEDAKGEVDESTACINDGDFDNDGTPYKDADGNVTDAADADKAFDKDGEIVYTDKNGNKQFDAGEGVNDADVNNKLVKYETNSNGELSKVTVVYTTADHITEYEKGSFDWDGYSLSEDTVMFNVTSNDDTTKTFKYSEVDEFGGNGENYAYQYVKVEDTDFDELEVVYLTDKITTVSSDDKVAMVMSVEEDNDGLHTIVLNDGSEEVTVEEDADIDLDNGSETDLDDITPGYFVKYRMNASNKVTYIHSLSEAFAGNDDSRVGVSILVGCEDREDADENNLATDVDYTRGRITVDDQVYNVGTDVIVFDASSYTDEDADEEKIEKVSLSDISEDESYVEIYKTRDDDENTFYVVIVKTENND